MIITENFRYQMFGKMNVLKNLLNRICEPILQKYGITLLQLTAICALKNRCVTNIAGLSRDTGIGQANTSTLCKKLETDGYITRTRSAEDERVVALSLTDKGLEIAASIDDMADNLDRLVENFPREKLEDMRRGADAAEELMILLISERGILTDA